ncbi:MAG TPA: hypothetical protein VEA16_09470, partial [Vicinamibacterales bacterium]|nr:hypothetical protein [Vicinamibacterales bacterium]
MKSGATNDVRELGAATLAYAVLTFLMALPFSLSPGSRVLDDVPDVHLFIWTLAWDTHAFLSQPLTIFDANIYHPFANTLAYSENLIGSALFAAPIIWLTGNPVLAMNLTALLTCVLCGTGAFLLARRLNMSIAAAFLCGVIFAFSSPRFIRIGQLHMTAVQWIPFCLAFLHTYLDRGTRRDLLLALACFTLQVLSSGHGAAFLVVAILVVLTWRFATGDALALRQRLRDIGVAGAYLLAPAVWILMPYRMAQTSAGLRRTYLSDAMPGVADFLASPSRFHIYLKEELIGALPREPDAFLFPGLLAPLLATVAVATWPAQRFADRRIPLYGLLAALSTAMFMAWPFEIWKYVYWLPGFNFIRVPSRFITLTMLALGVLAALGFEKISARLPRAGRLSAAGVVALLLFAEYSLYPLGSKPFTPGITAVDRWLDSRPKPFVFAEMPVPSA